MAEAVLSVSFEEYMFRKLALVGIIPKQIISRFIDKDGRTDKLDQTKKHSTAPPGDRTKGPFDF